MEPVKSLSPLKLNDLPVGEVRLAGKIQSSRRHEKNHFTLIVAPAIDEWSHPQRYELRSENKLGEKEDVINVRCRLSGSVRTFQYNDRESGEKKSGLETRVMLDVVE